MVVYFFLQCAPSTLSQKPLTTFRKKNVRASEAELISQGSRVRSGSLKDSGEL